MGGIGSGRKPDELYQARVIHLRKQGMSFGQIGKLLGVSRTAANRLYLRATGQKHQAQFVPAPPPPPRTWCRQCERNVLLAEAHSCKSQFCKALEIAA